MKVLHACGLQSWLLRHWLPTGIVTQVKEWTQTHPFFPYSRFTLQKKLVSKVSAACKKSRTKAECFTLFLLQPATHGANIILGPQPIWRASFCPRALECHLNSEAGWRSLGDWSPWKERTWCLPFWWFHLICLVWYRTLDDTPCFSLATSPLLLHFPRQQVCPKILSPINPSGKWIKLRFSSSETPKKEFR